MPLRSGDVGMKLGFVGLGVMGFPMAGHLAAAGHAVTVFNRSSEKTRRWTASHAGALAGSAADAAKGADLLVLCVGNDQDVRGIVTGALAGMAPRGIIVDHTTTSAAVAREMAELAASSGRAFIDAPVSGGQAGAEGGQLTIMCGGDPVAFERVRPAISAYAKAMRLMGGPGSGQLTKMVNQICIAGVVQGLAEGLHFAKRAGLDPSEVYEAISKGAAQSWQMDNRWKTMAEGRFDFGFAVDWMRKDLGLVLDEAGHNGARLAVAALVDSFYAELQAMGGGRWDTSSLVARLEPPR
jgi:3-hydroxyisobutyrate dehydrogenase